MLLRFTLSFNFLTTMKRTYIFLIIALSTFMFTASCGNYVQSVQPRTDVIIDDALTTSQQVNFLIAGLQQRMTQTYSQLTTLAGLLSDELYFDTRLPGATFPQFEEIERGQPTLDNNSVANIWGTNIFRTADGGLGSLRFHADNFIERLQKTQFTGDLAAQRQNAFYQGYLHAGLARYFYGVYFGLERQRGGGVISSGETTGSFVPTSAMMDSAVGMYNNALQNAATDLQRRTINTLIAKAYLADSRYSAARTAAALGLQRNDAPLLVRYSSATLGNAWYGDAGRGRVQMTIDGRFIDYIRADSLEGRIVAGAVASLGFTVAGFANTLEDADLATLGASRRLVVAGATANTPFNSGGLQYVFQLRYPNQNTSQQLTTWQENELMLAETSVRANNTDAALVNVNNVRASAGLLPRTAVALDSVLIERDKQLFGTGTRLIDQRRWFLENRSITRSSGTFVQPQYRNSAWHLLPTETWLFLPIPNLERSANRNLRGN
jgi:starch-binding outer membrane protein, SusD/RagB family